MGQEKAVRKRNIQTTMFYQTVFKRSMPDRLDRDSFDFFRGIWRSRRLR